MTMYWQIMAVSTFCLLYAFKETQIPFNVHSIHLMDYILCEKQVMMFWIHKLTHFSLEIKSARLNSLSDLSWHQVKQITKISQVLLIFPLQICSRNPNPFINIFWLHLICLKTLLFLQGFYLFNLFLFYFNFLKQ